MLKASRFALVFSTARFASPDRMNNPPITAVTVEAVGPPRAPAAMSAAPTTRETVDSRPLLFSPSTALPVVSKYPSWL